MDPEKMLMLAILQDAADCFQKYMFARNDRGRAIFDETEQWITEENNDWLFSLEGICECLGFDPESEASDTFHSKISRLGSALRFSAIAESVRS